MPPRVYGAGLGIYNMMFFVGSGFGAAISTALLAVREDAGSSLVPLYAGAERFTVFSDALLPNAVLIAVALLTLRVAARARPS